MIRAMRTAAWTTAVAAGLLLAACGGGGGGFLAGGGTSGTGITQGTVSSFGSVVVNGTRYRTIADDPAIGTRFEGAIDSEADLAVGMLVQVEWELPDGATTREATTIAHLPELVGPVTAVFTPGAAPEPSTLQVAGRTVVVDAATVLDDPFARSTGATPVMSVADLQPMDIVQVSGFLEQTAPDTAPEVTRIRASRIARVAQVTPGSSEVEAITGLVSGAVSTGTATGTFSILDSGAATITVEFNGIDVQDDSLLVNPADPTLLADGQAVRVEGQLTGGTLVASAVRRPLENLAAVQIPAGEDSVEAEIKGVVTEAAAGGEFRLNAQRVRFDSSTTFVGGNADTLQPGRRVEVTGRLVQDGAGTVLEADRIMIEPLSEVELEDRVTGGLSAANAEGERRFPVRTGITVVIRPDTVLKDDFDDSDDGRLRLPGDLPQGAFVEVRGFFNTAGELVATVLERDEAEAGCKLEARVDSFAETTGIYTFVGRPGLAVKAPMGGTVVNNGTIGEFETDSTANCGVGAVPAPPAGVDAWLVADADGVEQSDDGGILPDNGDDDTGGSGGGTTEDQRGVVATVDSATTSFTLESGETVLVNAATVFDGDLIAVALGAADDQADDTFGNLSGGEPPLTLAQLLPVGTLIELDGTIQADGSILATKIEDVAPN